VAFEDGFVIVAASLSQQLQGEQTRGMEQSGLSLVGNVVQKSHIVCKIVHEITSLGDEFVRKANGAPSSSSSSKLSRNPKPMSGPQPAVEAYIAASTLYLHALVILKSLLGSLEESLLGGRRGDPSLDVLLQLRDVRC